MKNSEIRCRLIISEKCSNLYKNCKKIFHQKLQHQKNGEESETNIQCSAECTPVDRAARLTQLNSAVRVYAAWLLRSSFM